MQQTEKPFKGFSKDDIPPSHNHNTPLLNLIRSTELVSHFSFDKEIPHGRRFKDSIMISSDMQFLNTVYYNILAAHITFVS